MSGDLVEGDFSRHFLTCKEARLVRVCSSKSCPFWKNLVQKIQIVSLS